jgi:hypothetical protein
MLTGSEFVIAGVAAFAAGIINAFAGGGTLVSFPVLVALGIPEISANITNTVALCPGYLGGTIAQKESLRGQRKRLWLLLPAGVAGGVVGGGLLVSVNPDIFHLLVPFLILFSAALLAVQDRVRELIKRHPGKGSPDINGKKAVMPVGLAAVYGGYFGAGLSVIILAVLGIVLDDTLTRINALKQCISLFVNIAAAIFFLFSGMVIWQLALVMAFGALIGGVAGGRVAERIKPGLLRRIIVIIGIVVGIIFLLGL